MSSAADHSEDARKETVAILPRSGAAVETCRSQKILNGARGMSERHRQKHGIRLNSHCLPAYVVVCSTPEMLSASINPNSRCSPSAALPGIRPQNEVWSEIQLGAPRYRSTQHLQVVRISRAWLMTMHTRCRRLTINKNTEVT